jgi:hypothetical protein
LYLAMVLDVVLQARGFVVDGPGEGSLTVASSQAGSTLRFKVTALELGMGRITVFAFHQQQLLGSVTLAPTVLTANEPVGASREHRQGLQAVHRGGPPDLVLMIFESQSSGRTIITFILSARDAALGIHMKKFGPVQLDAEPLKHFQAFFDDIDALPLGTAMQREQAERRLASKGCLLFEKVIPAELQLLLWSLRSQIKSVLIESEEPWFPWEMFKLQARENGRVVEGPFFCEASLDLRRRQIGRSVVMNSA